MPTNYSNDNGSKKFEIILELRVEAVSCPGVWLCPNGQVSLSVCALGSVFQTKHLPPLFPLCFDDKFYFRKMMPFYPYDLTLLIDSLDDEAIYCELVQWNGGCSCGLGRVLARYSGLIGDLLFPPYTCKPAGVDLLMKPSADFPGILAPKIEVTTLIRMPDVLKYKGAPYVLPCSPRDTPFSPRRNTVRVCKARRQKAVCHSPDFHQYSEPDFKKKYTKAGQNGPDMDIVEFSAPCRKHKDFNKEYSHTILKMVSSGNEFDPQLRYRDSLPECTYSSHNILPEKCRYSSIPQQPPMYNERTLPRDEQYRAEVITKNPPKTPKSPPKVSISSPLERIEVDRCQVCQGLNYEKPSKHRSKEECKSDSCKSGHDGCLICYKYFAVFKSESST